MGPAVRRTPARLPWLAAAATFAVSFAIGHAQAKPTSRPWTLRVAVSWGISAVDPALSPTDPGDEVYSEICANLYRYPDVPGRRGAPLVAEVAKGSPRVSRDGRTYTFTLRRGFRFWDGAPVRAENFKAAIDRDLNPKLNSTGGLLLGDVVGAKDVMEGRASTASGVTARGYRLTIRLTAPGPDLPARLSAPQFCSIPKDTPRDHAVIPRTAGPYYVARLDSNILELRRNPHYAGHRPRNPARIVYLLRQKLDDIIPQVVRGNADLGHAPLTEDVAKQYPKRLHLGPPSPTSTVLCLALNNDRPLFKNNLPLRQAVNFAIDRKALSPYFGYPPLVPTDQYLSPSTPGFKDAKIYPLTKPDFRKARRLAAGHLRSRKAILYTRNASKNADARARIVQYDLGKIGLNVEIHPATGGAASRKGEPFDIVDVGCAFAPPYPDPRAALALSFDGALIRDTGNTNVAYFNDPTFNKRFAKASRLRGRARLRTYGKLDVDLARDAAPAVAYGVGRTHAFLSQRIGCTNPLPAAIGAFCLRRS